MNAARALLFSCACFAAFAAPRPAAADIYQWVDGDGVVHFSNRPGGGGKLYLKKNGDAPGRAVPPRERDPSRFTRYDEHIRQAAALYQIPVELVRAVIKVESDYDPRAVSVSGARGLMQLMPPTAERLQVRDIDDPRDNIFGGVRYLRILANNFNGDLELTVAGYNAGEEAVMRYGGIPPYQQTRDYVVKVVAYYRRYRTTVDVVEASML
ncbi:MAG: lytic transglycosylase domain-containing protein [Myxococcales bacterium]|nr:lytic transglycosylase domain-containing protein [Myxococcales bacterium]